MSKKHFIQIRSDPADNGWRELLRVMECSVPVEFSAGSEGGVACSGELVFADEVGERGRAGDSQLACLNLPGSRASQAAGELVELKIRFADSAEVPFPFRGRTVVSKAVDPGNSFRSEGDEKVLASSDNGPLWVVSAGSGPKRYRSALALPAFSPDCIFRDVFNGDRFIEVLPVLQFLHEVCGDHLLEGPPLRACFIFDDPNLHWPRYGFVDYQQIAARAAAENYHVSFATIPLDAWFTHGRTARFFRNNAERLSLCVHGNNHTRQELAGDYSQAARVALLNQARHRVERLERSAGVQVCRVMVPPHGACSEEMLAELPGCAFEAACISHGSLHAYNQTKPWTRNLGCLPSELIHSCPVLPRWGFSGNINNTILLAAFLRQPIVLRGHHQDLKDGMELLDKPARFINSLGPVRWANMTELSRMNYQWRMEGTTCRLKPLGRKMKFQLPKQAMRLNIESPGNGSGENWAITAGAGISSAVRAGEDFSLPETFRGALSIENASASPVLLKYVRPRLSAAGLVRRLLTEGRDRFLS